MGRGVLIGQRAYWLMTSPRESIDGLRAKSDRLHAYRDKWQVAATTAFLSGKRLISKVNILLQVIAAVSSRWYVVTERGHAKTFNE